MILKKNISLDIYGLVQGVGFRPYLHKKAREFNICGRVRNTSDGLSARLEGEEKDLEAFINGLKAFPPRLAYITKTEYSYNDVLEGFTDFEILESLKKHGGYTFAGADTAPCEECMRELYDPSDRRYRYAFINCTNCGPRYSIIRSLPYDRANTAMDGFKMCGSCQSEFNDIEDRRYHAQPDCCGKCGPEVFFLDKNGSKISGDPFIFSGKLISSGGILAVKGTGGIHLACDATNDKAVKRLRELKNRPARPLAVMARDIKAAGEICDISKQEAELLESPARPIVLLALKNSRFPELSFSRRLGVMLPYTPMHYLLFDAVKYTDILVMTSANKKGCPVLTDNDEALEVLDGIADGYLFHNRDIENRIDDSVAAVRADDRNVTGGIYFFRRSRGYAPLPLSVSDDVSNILAFGAEQKGSFTIGKGRFAFSSPHIGDLKNMETFEHYDKTLKKYMRLFDAEPKYLACDMHPDYFSTRAAVKMSKKHALQLMYVQHHWAHMASCMADNGLTGPVFGIIWDGTGLGGDGSIWGCEFLKGDYSSYKRAGSIRPIALPGGDSAVININRTAFSLLYDCRLDNKAEKYIPSISETEKSAISAMISGGINCPKASSAGRLFDGIYSLLTQTGSISYDGEAAQKLEALSENDRPEFDRLLNAPVYPLSFYTEDNVRKFDIRPIVESIAAELDRGVNICDIAEKFMLTLCRMAFEQTLALNTERLPVVLSGGVFFNMYILSGVSALLENAGYKVYTHRRVSPCDEGVSLGQLVIAACAKDKIAKGEKNVSCTSDENNKG